MEGVLKAPPFAPRPRNRWTNIWDHSIFRVIRLPNIWYPQHRLCWCSKTCTVLQNWEARINVSNKWCTSLQSDEGRTLPNNGLEKCSLCHTWTSCVSRHGMEPYWFRSTASSDIIEPHPKMLPGNDILCIQETLQMQQGRIMLHNNVCMSPTDW